MAIMPEGIETMFYSTRIMTVDLGNGAVGYQADLVRRDGVGFNNCITGAVWFERPWAQMEAEKMLEAASDLFDAIDGK